MQLPPEAYVKNCPYCQRFKVRPGKRICSGCESRLRRGETVEGLHREFLNIRQPIVGKPEIPSDPTPEEQLTYEEQWAQFKAFIGVCRERKIAQDAYHAEGTLVRYGVISDLHIPFHNQKAFVEAVEWMQDMECDVVYVGGDILDFYSMSRFNQYRSVPIQQEFQEARKALDYLSRTFSEVRLIEGNHEARERKYLSARLDPNILNFVLQKSMLQRCAEDMKNVHVCYHEAYGARMGWLTPVGDAVIGHPEKQSKLPLKPVEWFNEWLQTWHYEIGLSIPRLVIAGHTHMAGITFVGQVMVVESGCLCLVQGYALEPRLYAKPQRMAATIFDQVNGKTDHNSVRQFYPCQV